MRMTSFHLLLSLGLLGCLLLLGTNWRLVTQLYAGYQRWQATSRALQKARQAPAILARQEQQLCRLQEQLARYRQGRRSFPDHLSLLAYLEVSCREQGVQLTRLPREATRREGRHTFAVLRFQLTGELLDMLRLLHRWESQDRLGRLTALRLSRQRQGRGLHRQQVLQVDVCLERLLPP
jgi:hypothetical protein